ncbi:O(6)-methylguanine-induced apoptosis 2 isoform X3 [Clinocottus analis]|uniref:O(6)-methylguanine-induced apoptosis 2 isoform X3 n=1 Tax=Clinocottus analis TaxID=304258 RepID=UPI0035BF9FC7
MGNVDREVHNNMIPVSSTMPTKDQRGVIGNLEKLGFSSQAKRFPSQDFLNGNPGPGSYGFIASAEVESPSFSKKGTTGFVASKVRCDIIGKSLSSANGTSTFLSKTGRDSMYPNKNEPSPCHYEVSGYLIPDGSKAVLSPFKSKTQRILPPLDHRVPGPGAYSPHQTPAPVKRTILPRGFYLTISAAPIIVPKDPLLPGPAQYDIRGCDGLSKHPMPTAAFASKTDRIPEQSDRRPGPGFYDPHILPKQSFFYNNSRVWLPV